jgi:hypothetical protein
MNFNEANERVSELIEYRIHTDKQLSNHIFWRDILPTCAIEIIAHASKTKA